MAGHSKWANIKHRKAAQDAKRGKIFTKLIRELTVAARAGGPEPSDNPRLRAAIDKALSNNMTKDTVERAIARGVGDADGDNVEEIVYEGYGPAGVAVLVKCLSDNRNRTVSDVRHAFSRSGGNLGTSGSVAYLFNPRGVVSLAEGVTEEDVMDVALDAGADDLQVHPDGRVEVLTSPQELGDVKDALDQAGMLIERAEVTQLPESYSEITDVETAQKVWRLIDALEDLDDVQEVYSNADFSDEVLAEIE
ncbi:hypothetical protein BFW38_07615 [Terasakiispira papahanaumokuakeensis]|uniref:Probable transcriptional regulatory protein BFW38_07615 n=1 Tax=Terasakiispira papahanaumokuakeensis TaxID=197479 RepID=A0A1E2V8X8_9GAMM|nr:YebC/PmpR family DNA-binding transcriptional regulator [Terasakiispira papahanaumokuakeensis]ODC03437.1 hypothetical protein BFW38_07615 [Terasakiispira papahanaumokuakeensis]